jgi:flagellar hook assembly protein FlgD
VNGARVRTLVLGPRGAGRHVVEWDGRDGAGRAVAPGVYFARLVVGPEARTARVVRLGP